MAPQKVLTVAVTLFCSVACECHIFITREYVYVDHEI